MARVLSDIEFPSIFADSRISPAVKEPVKDTGGFFFFLRPSSYLRSNDGVVHSSPFGCIRVYTAFVDPAFSLLRHLM